MSNLGGDFFSLKQYSVLLDLNSLQIKYYGSNAIKYPPNILTKDMFDLCY